MNCMLYSRVAVMSLPLQITLPAKWALKYTILGCFFGNWGLVLCQEIPTAKVILSFYPLPPLPPPYL